MELIDFFKHAVQSFLHYTEPIFQVLHKMREGLQSLFEEIRRALGI